MESSGRQSHMTTSFRLVLTRSNHQHKTTSIISKIEKLTVDFSSRDNCLQVLKTFILPNPQCQHQHFVIFLVLWSLGQSDRVTSQKRTRETEHNTTTGGTSSFSLRLTLCHKRSLPVYKDLVITSVTQLSPFPR